LNCKGIILAFGNISYRLISNNLNDKELLKESNIFFTGYSKRKRTWNNPRPFPFI
jgi:hypothetical protein